MNVARFFVTILMLFASLAHAGPSRTTYQAKIIKPDGLPLEASIVNFKFTFMDPSASCILYSETYANVNMSSTGGLVSFSLGSGNRTFPSSGTLEQMFSNITPSLPCDSGGPANYSPLETDSRKLVMQFNDGGGWQTLPAMNMNAVPYSMYSNDTLKLRGLDASAFVQYTTLPTCGTSQALRYTGAGFTCVTASGGAATVTSGSVITALGYTPADGASITALSSSVATTNSTVSTVSAAVYSVSSTVAGLTSQLTTLSNTAAASFAAITSSQWNTSGTTINYMAGNVGIGTSSPATTLTILGQGSTQPNSATWLTTAGVPLMGAFSDNSASGSNDFLIGGANNSATTRPVVIGRKSRGTLVNPTALASGDTVFSFMASGYDGNAFANPASIDFLTSGAVTSGTIAMDIAFKTGVTSRAERMRIDSLGNVGIGTTAPESKLQVIANPVTGGSAVPLGNESSLLISTNPSGSGVTGYFGSVWFGGKETGLTEGSYKSVGIVAYSPNDMTTTSADGNMLFYTTPVGSLTAEERMRIDSSGNVGIGTTAPTAKLHIAAGTASNAPIKLTSGTLLTSPQSGTIEYDGLQLYFTDSTNTRRVLAGSSSAPSNSSDNNYTGINTFNGQTYVSNNTASTNSTTGALVVSGGVGIGGSLNVANNLNVAGSSVIDGTLRLSAMTSGSVLFAGANGTVTQDNSQFFWDNSNQRLGLGTVTPTTKLHVSGGIRAQGLMPASQYNGLAGTFLDWDGTANLGRIITSNVSNADLGFYTTSSASATETMRITSSGNVGIGTSSPVTKLDVVGNGRVYNPVSNSNFNIGRLGDAIYYNALNVFSGYNGSNPSLSLSQDFQGSSINSYLGTMRFGVGATASEAMRITSAGNVGIGTGAPIAKLDIRATVSSSVGINAGSIELQRNESTSSSNGGFIDFKKNFGEDYRVRLFYDDSVGIVSEGGFVIRTNTDGSTLLNRMVITGNGNVGIGTTTPSALLQLAAGNSSTAPLKLTSGTLTTSPQSGTIEYDGNYYYITDGTNTRRAIATVASPGTYDNASNLTSTGNITMTPTGSVIVSSTTASTNSNTGALIVNGGLGVAGNINSSGTIITSSNIQGTSITATSGVSTNVIQGVPYLALNPNGGNVGVGTTNPEFSLDVSGVVQTSNLFQIKKVNSQEIRFNGGSSNQWRLISTINGATNGQLDFTNTTDNFGASFTTPLSLLPSGNVGIGTTNPTNNLEVAYNGTASPVIGAMKGLSLTNTDTTSSAFGGLYFRAADDGGIIRHGAAIAMGKESSWVSGSSSYPSYLSLWTRPVSTGEEIERLRITSTGNVGIGTSAPTSLLHVYKPTNGVVANFDSPGGGTVEFTNGFIGSNSALFMLHGNSAASGLSLGINSNEFMRLSSTGNVGIGTPSPDAKLSIVSDSGSNALTRYTVSGTKSWEVGTWSDGTFTIGDYGSKQFNMLLNGNVGIGTTTPAQRAEIVGNYGFNNSPPATSGTTQNGILRLGANSGAAGEVLDFGMNVNTGLGYAWIQPTNRTNLAVNYNLSLVPNGGNVGIGTTAPTEKLEVSGAIKASSYVFDAPTGDPAPTISARTVPVGQGASNEKTELILFHSNDDNNGAGSDQITLRAPALSFQTYASASVYTINDNGGYNERMYINSAGNVGIGTTAPTARLQVNSGHVAAGLFSAGAVATNYGTSGIGFNLLRDQANANWYTQTDGANNGAAAIYGNIMGDLYFLTTPTTGNSVNSLTDAEAFASTRMTVLANGNVGIGTVSPTQKLEVNGSVLATAYLYTSDRRLKKDFTPLENSLDKLSQLNTVKFNWIAPLNKDEERLQIGLIAQDVQKQFPEAVKKDEQGWLRLNYTALISPIIDAIKKLAIKAKMTDQKTEQLQKQVVELELKNRELEDRLQRLEKLIDRKPASK